MKLGVIGGSGLYAMEGLTDVCDVSIDTPFGAPSETILRGTLGKLEIFFLPRHGKQHTILPSEINYRANLFALKSLGVEAVISVTAVGSLQEQYRPRDIVVVDQFYDRTKNSRGHTFFGDGIAAHVPFADPTCPELSALLAKVASDNSGDEARVHTGGTYVNIEGPAFSTRAESMNYKEAGFDVVGMTCLAEAKLAREAELCFGALAMVTDYDCWKQEEEAVTVDMVIANAKANTILARSIIQALAQHATLSANTCSCRSSLAGAIMTAPEAISADLKERLDIIVGPHL